MDKSLQNIAERAASTAYLWDHEKAQGSLTSLVNGDSAPCEIDINWSAGKGLSWICSQTTAPLDSFATTGLAQSRIDGTLTGGDWAGWTIRCESGDCFACHRHSDYVRDEQTVEITCHQSVQTNVVFTAPGTVIATDDTVVYWMQNFLPELGGFEFEALATWFSISPVTDLKDLENRFRKGDQRSAVTALMKVRGSLLADQARLEEAVACAVSLISAIYGAWVTPFAYARYSQAGLLVQIIFPSTGVYPYHSHRSFMSEFRVRGGWRNFMGTALPQFVALHKQLCLRSVCRQIVEAHYPLAIDSQIAILLMCLEQTCTRYLASSGISAKDMNLQAKANACNRTLSCLPRSLRQALDTVRKLLRDPLFHEGATAELDAMALVGHRLDLLNAAVVLLSAICGYRGPLQLADIRQGERIITVDVYAGGP